MIFFSKPSVSALSLVLLALLSGCNSAQTPSTKILGNNQVQQPSAHKIKRANWVDVNLLAHGVLGDLQITSDAEKLSLRISNSQDLGAHVQFFLDVDNDAATGFQFSVWPNSGSNYLIEDNILFKARSNTSSWDWEYIGTVDFVKRDNAIEVEVNKSLLENLNSTFKVGVMSRTRSWKVDKMLPSSASMAQYTIGNIENPPVDNEAPKIKIIGQRELTVVEGEPYQELGATANDNSDGDITNLISTTGSVNVHVQGRYEITYFVTDSAGNSTSQVRVVHVVAKGGVVDQNDAIVVDGLGHDWVGISAISSGLKVTHDDERFYFIFEGDIGKNTQIFLDTDNDDTTGFKINSFAKGGADYLIENDILYKSKANGPAWQWDYVTPITYAKSNQIAELSIEKSTLNIVASEMKIAAIARTSSWGVISQTPSERMVSYKIDDMVTPPPANVKPTAKGQSVTVYEGKSSDIILSGSDADGDSLSYHIKKMPIHGTLSLEAAHVSYVPDDGYFGDDSFTFVVNDGSEDSNEAKVTLHVKEVVPVKGEFAEIKKLIKDAHDGMLENVHYISVGDSTRAISDYYHGGELYRTVSKQLQENGVQTTLQAVAGHTLRKWNDYDGQSLLNQPTWETTVAEIPDDGSTTILNISLGINDARYYGNGGEKERIKFHMIEAIDKILAIKPETKIMLTMPERLVGMDTKTSEIKAAYEEIALEKDLPLINTIDDLFSGDVDLSLYRAEDAQEYGSSIRIHLSSKGQALVSDLILGKILP